MTVGATAAGPIGAGDLREKSTPMPTLPRDAVVSVQDLTKHHDKVVALEGLFCDAASKRRVG